MSSLFFGERIKTISIRKNSLITEIQRITNTSKDKAENIFKGLSQSGYLVCADTFSNIGTVDNCKLITVNKAALAKLL